MHRILLRSFRTFCSLVVLLILAAPPARGQSQPPNVLLVLTDDQGWGDVHAHGNSLIETPTMDRLASEGASFARFYVSPVCAPTRASLLTGRYSLRTGVQWVTRGLETMRPEEVTIAEVFRDAGYRTGIFGKWHNGEHYPSDPAGQGFERVFGFTAGHFNNYFDPVLKSDGTRVRTEGFITDVLTDAAIAFIESSQSRPFLAYVPFNAPHSPFQAPQPLFEKYKARGLDDKTAAVYAMVENLDDNLQRLLATLYRLGIADNTIVVFMTDNGPNGERYNGFMRGIKASVHEGGVRVPLYVRWPGRVPSGRIITQMAAHIDLLPTLAELTGVRLPDSLSLDGRSLVPLLTGDGGEWPDRMLFFHHSRAEILQRYPGAVRTADFRLVRETPDEWQLFNLRADPAEQVDVSRLFPRMADSLARAYDTWYDGAAAGLRGSPPIAVGYAAAPTVELPVTEAIVSGNVHYEGGSGWANDWLTGWIGGEDRVWWDLDVKQAGRYRVEALYTAPASSIGAKVFAASGGRETRGVVREAYDPPLLPSPDLVPRGEVYEKEWATLDLGILPLAEGPQTLTLRGVTRPGGSVMDLKAIRLVAVAPARR